MVPTEDLKLNPFYYPSTDEYEENQGNELDLSLLLEMYNNIPNESILSPPFPNIPDDFYTEEDEKAFESFLTTPMDPLLSMSAPRMPDYAGCNNRSVYEFDDGVYKIAEELTGYE